MHLPDSLGDRLKQVQTLDIRGTSVIKLPKSFIKLEKLQYIRAGTSTIVAAEYPSTSVASMMSRPRATMVSWMSKLSTHHHTDDGSRNGVKVPRGIGKLSSLHTLGVIDISAAGNEDVLEDLKNLTQLHKLGVSGINWNNSKRFFSAISRLYLLESLSLQVQLGEDDNQAGCLDNMPARRITAEYDPRKKRTMQKLTSLKLYGFVRTLPEWTSKLENIRKLSLQMTMLPQEGLDILQRLVKLRSLRLFLSEFQDDKLVGGFRLDFLEISCNSRLQATIAFGSSYLRRSSVRVLRIRCWHVASLRTSGLQHVGDLKEVWLSGPCDKAHRQHFESELAKYPESLF